MMAKPNVEPTINEAVTQMLSDIREMLDLPRELTKSELRGLRQRIRAIVVGVLKVSRIDRRNLSTADIARCDAIVDGAGRMVAADPAVLNSFTKADLSRLCKAFAGRVRAVEDIDCRMRMAPLGGRKAKSPRAAEGAQRAGPLNPHQPRSEADEQLRSQHHAAPHTLTRQPPRSHDAAGHSSGMLVTEVRGVAKYSADYNIVGDDGDLSPCRCGWIAFCRGRPRGDGAELSMRLGGEVMAAAKRRRQTEGHPREIGQPRGALATWEPRPRSTGPARR